MTYVAMALCSFIVAVGALGIVSPPRLLKLLDSIQSPAGLYFASGFRILLGFLLILLASDSRAPLYLRGFGVLAVAAGLVGPFVGLARIRRLLTWWKSRSDAALRAWAVFAVALGASLLWALAG